MPNEARDELLNLALVEGNDIEYMKATAGWTMLEDQMLLTLSDFGKQLMKAEDLKDLYRTQGKMEAINSIFSFVSMKEEAKQMAKEEMEGGE